GVRHRSGYRGPRAWPRDECRLVSATSAAARWWRSRRRTVEEAIRLIRERAIRRIPVVEGGNAVGIVSIGDLAIERDEQSALGAQDRSVHVRWPVASGPLLSDRKRRRPRMVASCSST